MSQNLSSENISSDNISKENNLENPYMTPRNKPITLQNIHNQKHKYKEYKKNLNTFKYIFN